MPVVPLSRPAPGTAKKKAKAKPKAAARDWPRLVAKARRVGLAVAAAVATGALVARAVADPRLRHWVATRATAGLHHGLFGLPWTLTAPLAGVFLAMLMVPLVVLGRLDKHDQGIKLLGRVGPYVPAAAAAADWSVASSAADVVTKVLRSRGTEQKLATRLDLAGIKRRPGEWVLLTCGVCLALAAGLSIVTGSLPLGLVGAVVVGWLGPRCVVSFLVNRRRSAFAAQLPEVLEIIAGSLQSGLTLNRALDTVVNQDLQPAATELSRAQSDQRLGAEMEDALDAVAERMASDDLAWTVIAIRIQKQVGGNMVEVLRTVVNTMRERAYLRRQVKSLSAEGRFSAYILIALPILIGGWLFYSSPSYMSPLYTTATGLLMLGGAVVMVVAGTMWMRKLIRIEV